MNRIFRLVFNQATGLTQVASELTTTHSSIGASRALPNRRTPLSAALVVAMGLSAGAVPVAFAQVHEFNSNETITSRFPAPDGFVVAPSGVVDVDVTGVGDVQSDADSWLGRSIGSIGRMRVSGNGAELHVNNGASLWVGDAGRGELTVESAARANITGTIILGGQQGAYGALTVRDSVTLLETGALEVGRGGTGQVDITTGGRITTNTTTGSAGLSIGVLAGSSGVVNVDNNSTLEVLGNTMVVGQAGVGKLNVGFGSNVAAKQGVRLGAANGATGTVQVNANGMLETDALTLGEARGASGFVTIEGADAVVDAPIVWVGSTGSGTLTVKDGGVLKASTSLIAERFNGAGLGAETQVAKIIVNGTNSRITAGQVEATSVELSGGGTIVSSSARVKDSFSPLPYVADILDSGSKWINDGEMRVESALMVRLGGEVSTGTLIVNGGSNALVLPQPIVWDQAQVTGNGSLLTARNGITIGQTATAAEPYGVLVADDNGRIDAGTGYTLATNGYLVVGGGPDQWDVGSNTVTWRYSNIAGDIGNAPITMQVGAGGLMLNHIREATLTNALISERNGNDWTAGTLSSREGTTTLNGDLGAFGGKVDVVGGTLIVDGSMYTGQGYTDPAQALAQQIDVSGGTLVLNGSSGFQQTLNVGGVSTVVRSSTARAYGQGVLAGNAVVGETHVTNGGVLSPGYQGVGVFTVDGDLYLNAGGAAIADVASAAFYDVDLRGNGQADLLAVNGRAFVGRNANVGESGVAGLRVTGLDPARSYQNGYTYTVLTAAGGIQGGFDAVTSNSDFITPTLSQRGDQVLLTIAVNDSGTPGNPGNPGNPGTGNPGTPGDPDAPPPPQVFNPAATNPNQANVAQGLNSLQQSGEALALYNALLLLDAAQAQRAFDELSGETHASNRAMLLDDRFLREGIAQRLRPDPTMAEYGPSLWVAGNGSSRRQDANEQAASVREDRQGLIVGMDWSVGEGWKWGIAVGPEKLRQRVRDRNSTTDADAVHAGLYVGWQGDAFGFHAGASYADYDVDTERSVGAGYDWAQQLNSQYSANAVSAFAEGGWDLDLDPVTLTPYLALSYTRLDSDALQETGGSAALAVAARKDDAWTTTAGLRAAWQLGDDRGIATRLEAGLAWQHSGGDVPEAENRFVAGSSRFSVQGLPLARNVGVVELGVSIKPTDNSRLAVVAQGRNGGGQSEFGGQLSFNLMF